MATLYNHIMIQCHFLDFYTPLRYYIFFPLKSPKTILKEFDLNPRASGAQIYLSVYYGSL